MSVPATVGFFPASGQTTAAGAAGGKPAAETPLGLFGALLQLVASIGDDSATTVVQQQAARLATGSDGGHAVAFGIEQSTTIQSDANADAELPPDLLAELADILDALGVAGDADSLDPTLEDQAIDLLENLALALGVPLPAVKAAEVAAPLVGALAGAAIDALTGKAPSADTPPPDDGEIPAIAQKLAERLASLAAALEGKAPALAEKLAALGARIESGDIDLAALANLRATLKSEGKDALDPALMRLLSAQPEQKPSTVKAPFASPALDLPADMDAAEKTTGDVARPPLADRTAAEPARPDPATRPAATGTPSTPPVAETPGSNAQPTTANAAFAPTAAVTADTRAVHAAYAAPVRQINIPQVAVEIVRQVQAGATRFQIRLDPPELGRIDVKLDMDAAGNVNARMTVDRAETLDLMQRDHRALERALAQAGLDTSKTNLEFSLRQNPFAHQENHQRQDGGQQPWSPIPPGGDADTPDVPPPHVIAYRGAASPGGVNLFV